MYHKLYKNLIGAEWVASRTGKTFLNVNPVCRGIADQSGTVGERGGPDLTFRDCVNSEQEVKAQLAKQWSSFVAEDKKHCVNETQMGGDSSYTELLTCLEMARDIRTIHSDTSASNQPAALAPRGHAQPKP